MSGRPSNCPVHVSVLVLITGYAASSALQGHGSGQGHDTLEEEAWQRSDAGLADGRLMRRSVELSRSAKKQKLESRMITGSGAVTTASPSLQLNYNSKLVSEVSQQIIERSPEKPEDLFKKGFHPSNEDLREMAETASQTAARLYGHKRKTPKPVVPQTAQPQNVSVDISQGNESLNDELQSVCYHKVQGIKEELRSSGFVRELENEHSNPWSVLKFVGMQAKKRATDRNKFTICQTGFNYGISAAAFLCLVPSSRLISWDLGKHEYLEKALSIIYDRFAKRHTYIKGNSTKTLREAITSEISGKHPEEKHECDFVFIDGGHDAGTLTSDITNFGKLSSFGAPVVMNDCHRYTGEKLHEVELQVFQEAVAKGIIREEESMTRTFDSDSSGVCGGRYI